jgi:hypothetical protein
MSGNHLNGQQPVDGEWITFPGGELEGIRPRTLCPACRARLARAAASARRGEAGRNRHPEPLCFQCYRAGLDREKALRAAGQLDTASTERFQYQLPFEPLNRPRLDALKADRAAARATMSHGVAAFVDRRRQAQIAARHALQSIAAGLRARDASAPERDRVLALAAHAAELQLPDSWIPFVVAR